MPVTSAHTTGTNASLENLWYVASTPLDFRKPHLLSEHINDNYGQLKVVNGYDHAWALNHPGTTLYLQPGFMTKQADGKWKSIPLNLLFISIQAMD